MSMREKVRKKEAIIDNIILTVNELLVEVTITHKISDINKLFKCLVFLKYILLEQKRKLSRRAKEHLYT